MTKSIRSHHTRNNALIFVVLIAIAIVVFYRPPIESYSFRATDAGFEYVNNGFKSTITVNAYSNNEKIDFSKADKIIEIKGNIRYGVNFKEKVDYATFTLNSEKLIEKKSDLIYRSELKPNVMIDPIGNIKYLRRWAVYDFSDLKYKNPNSSIKEREENGTIIIEIFDPIDLDPTITEETQGEFDDGYFSNTTTDIHGNGSVRLQNKASLIMNFDVNGSISGNVTDISNNSYVAELNNGVVWNLSGKYGSAYSFDGVDDYISVDGGGGLNGLDNGTISMWVRWEGASQDAAACGFGPVIARQSNGVFSNNIIYLNGADPSSANIVWSPYDAACSNIVTSSATAGNGIWRHVVATFRANNQSLYIDGVYQGSNTLSTAAMGNDASTPLTIGGWIGDGAGYSRSTIDEVKVFNRVLNESEIISLNNSNPSFKYYSSGSYKSSTLIANLNATWNTVTARIAVNGTSTPIDTTSLILWYRFNESTGNRVLDSSSSGNNAGLNNSAFFSENSISDHALTFLNPGSCVTSDANLAISSQFTASAWVNVKGQPNGTNVNEIVTNRHGSITEWWRLVSDLNRPKFTIFDGTTYEVVSNTIIRNNTWTYLTGVYNSTHLLIYVNGILDNLTTNTVNPTITAAPIFVGCRYLAAPNIIFSGTFNGTIDEVMIFNRSLSSTEIFENYRNSLSSRRGGNITLQVSTSRDNATWTDFSSEVLLQDNTTLNLPSVAAGQYMNYTLNFKTNDTSATPYFLNITFLYFNQSTAPSVTTPTISPTTAYKNSIINSTVTPTDNETTLLNVTFQWRRNDMNIYNFTALSQNSGSASTAVLSAGNYSHFDNISVCVFANDDGLNSSVQCASNITILNSAPDAIVNISQRITRGRYAWVAWNYSDNDTDLQNGTVYTWFVNGTEAWKEHRLVGYWRLDGNALDSANNNHGTIQNGAVNLSNGGVIKGAYRFDGVNDHINISSTAQLNIVNNLSISAWFKAVAGGAIAAKPATNILLQNTPYSLGISDGGLVIFNVSNSTQVFHSQYQTTMNEWHNAIGTYNGSTMNLYVDGVLVNYTIASGQINTSARPFFIGGVAIPPLGVLFAFEGDIDEVKLWNRTLTETEAMQEYQQMKYGQTEKEFNSSAANSGTPSQDIPRILYRFDEGSGIQTKDYFGNTTGLLKSGPNWTDGMFGSKALMFDGTSNQLVNVSFNQNMNITRALTIEAWIKSNGVNPSRGYIVNKPINSYSDNIYIYISNFTDGTDRNTTIDNHGNNSLRLQDDAVLIMNFDVNGSDSNKTTDISNNANDGTITGSVFWNQSGGRYGSAYVFDGIDDNISIPYSNTLGITGSITLSAWVKYNKVNSQAGIIQKYYTLDKSYMLRDANGLAFVVSNDGSTDNQVEATGNSSPSIGVWHHLAGVYNTTHLLLYVDGVLNSSAAYSSGINLASGRPVVIGQWRATEWFNGTIDDVRIYNRSLSTTEIVALNNSYQTGKYYSQGVYKNQLFNLSENVTWVSATPVISINGNPENFDSTSLIGRWKFNETTGSIAYDSSGRGNDADLKNNPYRSDNSIIDYALGFQGNDTNDFANITYSSSIRLGNSWTVLGWYNSKDPNNINQRIFSKSDRDSSTIGDITMTYNNNGLRDCQMVSGATGFSIAYFYSTINTNNWEHIACNWNTTHLNIFVNGILVNKTAIASTYTDSSDDIIFGKSRSSDNVQNFNGTIDEIMLFNRSLSQTEIYNIYKNQLTGKASGGNITIQFQTSRDNATWSDLTGPTLLEDGVTLGISSDDGRYINYTLIFNTNDTITTPYIFNLTFITKDENNNVQSWFLSHMESGAIAFGTTNQTSKSNKDLPGTIILKNNTWYHVVATWNGTEQRIYINGTLDGTREFMGVLNLTSSPMMIGSSDIYTSGFNGTIEELAIYNRALSDVEINQSYRRGFPIFGYNTSSLVYLANLSVLIEPNDGYVFGSFIGFNITVNNTIPEARSVGLTPSTAFKTTTFNASVVAIDNDTDTMTVTFRWYNNSVNIINNSISDVQSGTNVTNTIQSSMYSHFGNISVEIKIEDTYSNSTYINSSTVQIQNTESQAFSVGLFPSTSNKTTSFNASVIAVDNDTDTMTVNFSWIINGAKKWNNSISSVTNGTNVTNTISNGNYSHFDNVTIEVRIFDGYTTSTFVNSTTAQIENLIPNITVPVISPNTPNINSVLNASVVAMDDDLDTMTVEFRWIKNTNVYVYNKTVTGQLNGSNVTALLTSGNFTLEDNISVEVYSNDGNVNSLFRNSTSVQITANKAPNINTPTISPTTSYEHSVLNATVTPVDNESALLNVTFQWRRNGQNIYSFTALNQDNNSASTAILLTGNFSHFDNITACAFANDTLASDTKCSSSLQITNSAPLSLSVGLMPLNSYEHTTMNASVLSRDNDTDAMMLTFRWYRNNVNVYNSTLISIANGTNSTNILTNGNFSHFDNISVEIRLEDPYTNATWINSSSVQILNTIPEARSVGLTPSTAFKTTTFNASVVAIDNDTDTMTATFYWRNNSAIIATNVITGIENGTNVTNTISNTLYNRFGNISVEIKIEDAYSNSTFVNSSTVQIQNFLPTINQTSLVKYPAFHILSLNASAIAIDEDLDTMTVNFSWIINGTIRTVNNSISSVANGTNITNTVSISKYNIGDNITVEIRIFDGANTSFFMNTSSLEIIANAPFAITPVISPQEPFTDTDITASSSIYHPNSTLLNVTFKWYKNNVYVFNNTVLNHPSNTTSSVQLTYKNYTQYDNISVEVYAFDGLKYSIFKNSTPVQIQKLTPSVSFMLDFSINGVSNDAAYADTNGTGFFRSGDIKNNFGCVQDSEAAYSIVFSGETFLSLNLTNSLIAGNSYRIRMAQHEQGDKFIVAITTGGCNSIRNKMPTIQSNKILTQPFYQLQSTGTYPLELIRNYRGLDIIGDIDRSGRFIIELENNGTNQIIARVK